MRASLRPWNHDIETRSAWLAIRLPRFLLKNLNPPTWVLLSRQTATFTFVFYND